VAPARGAGPLIKVYDGVTGNQARSFSAYSRYWTGGVNLAVGDVNGDGRADIITGLDAGSTPLVRVFNGKTLGLMRGFYAYSTRFGGGVRVAAGDMNADGGANIITSPGAGTLWVVKVFSGASGAVLSSFTAYGSTWLRGAFVAAGDIDGD